MPTLRSQQHQESTLQGRKRHLDLSSDPVAPNGQNNPPAKRQKSNHYNLLPAKFWDGLSEIPLTRNAVRELNRRNLLRSRPSRIQTPPAGRQHHPAPPRFVKRFARRGGPDLSDIRGYQVTDLYSVMSSSQSSLGRRKRGSQSPVKRTSQSPTKSTTANTTSTRSTGPYDRAFGQNLIDHNVFPDGYEYPDGTSPPEPGNLDDILLAMSQPRPSLSPSRFSKDDFKKFKRADTHAFNEREIVTNVMPLIEGTAPYSKCAAGEVLFSNLDDLTDGTIAAAKPDIYYGARPEQLDSRVRREKSNQIIPSSQSDLPILPNFFVELKGPDGKLAVATRQSSYYGATGTKCMHSIRSYCQPEPEYDNNAYTITSIYHGGTLKMYAHHPIPPRTAEGKSGFVTTQIKTWGLTGDVDTFRQGAAAFRNARDWAKEQRDNAIEKANEKVKEDQNLPQNSHAVSQPAGYEGSGEDTVATSPETVVRCRSQSQMSGSYGSDTSADVLSLELPQAK